MIKKYWWMIYSLGLLSSGIAIVYINHGYSMMGLRLIGLMVLLIALGAYDLRTMYMPKDMLLVGIGVGLVLVGSDGFLLALERLVLGGVTFVIVALLSKVTRGGISDGDGYVLAIIGIFLGWLQLVVIALVALVMAAVLGLCMVVLMQKRKTMQLPFVPFLGLSFWLLLFL